jgi:hypothetical protein
LCGGDKLNIKRQGLLIAFVICLIASMSAASAWTQTWNSGTGQPRGITSDGVNIYSANADGLKCVSPTGNQIWASSDVVSNNGSALKVGKYVFEGVGNDVKALNKADGSTKWTSTNALGTGQAPKYILVKGAFVIVSNDAKVVILNREDGTIATPVTNASTTCNPMLFGGMYIAGSSSGVQAYNAIIIPDIRVKSINKQADKTTATIENIGLSDATKVLVKWVVRKTDGTYRTIHISASTVPAGATKDVTINGGFSKGYAIVDPYYAIGELNEGNNQRYFS